MSWKAAWDSLAACFLTWPIHVRQLHSCWVTGRFKAFTHGEGCHLYFSSNSLFKLQLIILQSTTFPDCIVEKRWWKEVFGARQIMSHTFTFVCRLIQDGLRGHDFAIPSRGAERWAFVIHVPDGASYKTHTHTHTDREGWATIYDITVKIWETGSGFHGVLKIPTSKELDRPLLWLL